MEVCLRSACGEIELKTHVLRPLSAPERRRDSTRTIYKQNTKNVFSWLFRFFFMTFLDFPPPVWPLQVQRDRSILSLFTHSLTHWRASSGIRVGSRRQPWLWEWYLSKYYNCYDADFAYSVSLSRSLRILDWEQSWFHTPALILGVISILDPGGVRPAGKIPKCPLLFKLLGLFRGRYLGCQTELEGVLGT